MRKNKNQCKVKKCNRDVSIKKHQLCATHYARYLRHGDVNAHMPIAPRSSLPRWEVTSED